MSHLEKAVQFQDTLKLIGSCLFPSIERLFQGLTRNVIVISAAEAAQILSTTVSSRSPSNIPPMISQRRAHMVAGNLCELLAIAVQIASEIALFAGGMGFVLAPPLRKVYDELKKGEIGYHLYGSGKICIESTLTDFAFVDCKELNDIALLEKRLEFNLPYPEKLFTASILVFSLGALGLVSAFGLKKYGAYLLDDNDDMVLWSEKEKKYFEVSAVILNALSRAAAIYAATTISLTETSKNIALILDDFSFSSSMGLSYSFYNLTLKGYVDLTTEIDFSDLRYYAEEGSKELQHFDYYIAIAFAVVSLILGFIALKPQQIYLLLSRLFKQEEKDEEEIAESVTAVEMVELGQRNRFFSEAPPTLEVTTVTEFDEFESVMV